MNKKLLLFLICLILCLSACARKDISGTYVLSEFAFGEDKEMIPAETIGMSGKAAITEDGKTIGWEISNESTHHSLATIRKTSKGYEALGDSGLPYAQLYFKQIGSIEYLVIAETWGLVYYFVKQ